MVKLDTKELRGIFSSLRPRLAVQLTIKTMCGHVVPSKVNPFRDIFIVYLSIDTAVLLRKFNQPW